MRMIRLWLAWIVLCVVSGVASALPWPVEPRLQATAIATRQFALQRIHSLEFDGSDRLLISYGPHIGLWKPSQPKDIKSLGEIDGKILQITHAGNALKIFTQKAYSIRKYENGSLKAPLEIPLPNAGNTRFAAANTNQRTVFWSGDGDPVFCADATAKPIAIKLVESKLAGLALSSNGRLLAIATAGGSVRVGNLLANGAFDLKCSKRLPRREEMPMAFSPDGALLAVGDAGRLHLIDTNTGQPVIGFERRFDDGDISTITFSKDGLFVGIGTKGPSPVVRVWQISTGKSLGDFPTYGSRITALEFDSTGTYLASGDALGQVIVWKPTITPDVDTSLTKAEAWGQLDAINPGEGRRAMRALAGSDAENPRERAREIHRRLMQVDNDREELRKAIPLLDHNEYKVREVARRDLLKSGHRGMELLRDASRKKMGTEGEDQVRTILKTFEENGLHRPENEMYGDHLRILRAIQVIESLSPKDSRDTLEYLIQKYPKTRIARDAEAILTLP